MTDSVPLSKQKLESLESSYTLEVDEVLHQLATPPYLGLSSGEVARRLNEVGPNQLAEAPPTSIWQMLWEQFNNFVVWLLVVASLVSATLGGLARSDCDSAHCRAQRLFRGHPGTPG